MKHSLWYANLFSIIVEHGKVDKIEIKANSKGIPLGFGCPCAREPLSKVEDCSDKRKSDLGVRCLSLLNKAILCKWCGRIMDESWTLWKQVISWKYEEKDGGGSSLEVKQGYALGIRKGINKNGIACNRNALDVGNA